MLSGVTLPYNPAAVEFGATLSGIDPSLVLATYDNGNAAIIARDGIPAPVPEPCSLALLGLGAPAVLAARRRRTRKTEA